MFEKWSESQLKIYDNLDAEDDDTCSDAAAHIRKAYAHMDEQDSKITALEARVGELEMVVKMIEPYQKQLAEYFRASFMGEEKEKAAAWQDLVSSASGIKLAQAAKAALTPSAAEGKEKKDA